MTRLLCALLLLIYALGAAAAVSADDCRAGGQITPICGFQAPEDLALTPDRRALLVAEFGGLVNPVPGRLTRLDLQTHERVTLYPVAAAVTAADWGDPACPGAPGKDFAPHGTHLSQRADGRWQLLVVNHFARESVEFFELQGSDRLVWRGCVVFPGRAFLNDVVGFTDGSLVATNMVELKEGVNPIAELLSGTASGKLWQWSPGQGVSTLPGPPIAFANGIERSANGQLLYVNAYHSSQVIAIERATGKVIRSATISKPDNSYPLNENTLLVASHTGDIDYENGECHSLDTGFCPVAFQIVALDMTTMETALVFAHQGAPMGGGTVAVPVDNHLYIGSFSGDRLIRVELSGNEFLLRQSAGQLSRDVHSPVQRN